MTPTPHLEAAVTDRRTAETLPCDIPEELPILALSSTVVFPATVVSLQVVREQSLDLVRRLAVDEILGLVLQKHPGPEIPPPDQLTEMGVAARLANLVNLSPTSVQLILIGLQRFRVEAYLQTTPYLRARIGCLEIPEPLDSWNSPLIQETLKRVGTLVRVDPRIPRDVLQMIENNLQGPGHLADQLANHLNFQVGEKIEILQCVDPVERLHAANGILRRHIAFGKVAREIQERTEESIAREQREYFLREQMKTIRRELGEPSPREARVRGFRDRMESGELPEAVRPEAEREIERLESLPEASPEYGVALSYLDWLFHLPWNRSTEDRIDLERARRILDRDHLGLDNVKKRILEFLAVRHLREDRGRGPILCFFGPPGTGKTSLGRSIAEALGRRFFRVSVGGMRDEAEIRGHRRTYVGAMPGKILQGLRRVESNNPLFMIDEIDKLGTDFRGDPASALLEVLDPEENSSFTDLYLNLPFDLSRVLFIATANQIDSIPAALLDRMEPIPLPGYSEEEKVRIAERHLLPRQREAAGLSAETLRLPRTALLQVIRRYTRDAGLRRLERHLAQICRSIAREIVEEKGRPVARTISARSLPRYLGPPPFFPETAEVADEIGIATALAWTPAGGEILFIETTRVRGPSGLRLTGQMGEVMKESAQAALTYIRARAARLGIDDREFDRSLIHIHVPAGAIPKDGPSAGLAIAAALASLFTGRPVRHDVALTGEITLRGRVLPVGGMKEKALAAARSGIAGMVLPARNQGDLAELPGSVRRRVGFFPVRRVMEALDRVLRKPIACPARPARTSRRSSAESGPAFASPRAGRRPAVDL
ncbi:MAG: endopeptidase La [Acidobacteria bacterium]|nr:endopeptidase La [Acidobacteriota bacterium]